VFYLNPGRAYLKDNGRVEAMKAFNKRLEKRPAVGTCKTREVEEAASAGVLKYFSRVRLLLRLSSSG